VDFAVERSALTPAGTRPASLADPLTGPGADELVGADKALAQFFLVAGRHMFALGHVIGRALQSVRIRCHCHTILSLLRVSLPRIGAAIIFSLVDDPSTRCRCSRSAGDTSARAPDKTLETRADQSRLVAIRNMILATRSQPSAHAARTVFDSPESERYGQTGQRDEIARPRTVEG